MGDAPKTSVTIPGVPESIPRQQLVDMLATLGIDAQVVNWIHIDRDGIKAHIYAAAPGTRRRRYVERGGKNPAMHTLHIKLDG